MIVDESVRRSTDPRSSFMDEFFGFTPKNSTLREGARARGREERKAIMRGPDFSNIRATLNRINSIQQKLDAGTNFNPDAVSFNTMLQHSMRDAAGGGISANQILNNLNCLNNIDYLNAQTFIDLSNPEKIINFRGYEMQAQTADRLQKLEYLIAKEFPGRKLTVTSTTGGRHSDQNHYTGKAVDFVVDGLTKEESLRVEELCKQTGLTPYNEYINSSAYKTGDHMHVDLM